jgi:hypothetical protein
VGDAKPARLVVVGNRTSLPDHEKPLRQAFHTTSAVAPAQCEMSLLTLDDRRRAVEELRTLAKPHLVQLSKAS